jgi:two-component system sensor histidine kinase LytS
MIPAESGSQSGPARRAGSISGVDDPPVDEPRREAAFTWVSSRRGASARAGRRRWADLRGPALAAAVLGLLQAGIAGLALQLLGARGVEPLAVVPVVAATTFAMVLFLGLVRGGLRAENGLGDGPAPAILEVLAVTTPVLHDGLTPAAAQLLAGEARARLGYAAVAVTDRERVLAHVGLAADHHGAGVQAPPGAIQAMEEARVARLPVGWRHGCDPGCPLGSAVVGPLVVRGRVLGSLIAFAEGPLSVSDRERDVVDSLCSLVSTALAAGEVEVHARASASAELAALQAQIEPHFLFNALNTIGAFIRTQPDEARRLVITFAEYCRSTLRQASTFVTLDDELEHVDAYLALEEARFGPDLVVERRIAPAARDVLIPPFLIQPLVENAVKHGKADQPLRIVVRADRRFGRLRVVVRDNGRGIAREDAERVLEPGFGSGAAGLGLASVHRRIQAHYGEEGRLRIASSPLFGTYVSVLVPDEPPAGERVAA